MAFLPSPFGRASQGIRLASCTIALLLAGCAVGPDYHKPAPPGVGSYTTEPLATATFGTKPAAGEAQHFERGAQISADWWTLFHSKALDRRIAQALAKNPDLEAAQAALASAHESVLAQRGADLPTVSGALSASRQRQSAALAPVPNQNVFTYNLFTPEVAISYVPDIFGLNRRTIESLAAQQQAVRYRMAATYVTLTANVVVAAIEEASVAAQIEAVRDMTREETQALALLREQFARGYASGLDVAAQEAQLAQASALLPPLARQRDQLHDLMSALTGRFPAETPEDSFKLDSLTLPRDLPLSLPSQLVEQRPDVLQAEANLHAASADIGIAVANRLPNIAISANAGSTALSLDKLFAAGTGFWSVGADLAAPIFEGGALLHRERAARANYREAAAQYRSTVLAAFQNVADTLYALETDADALQATTAAFVSAKKTRDLSRRQAKDGYAGDLALFAAEQSFQQAKIALVQAQAARFADTAALFEALGGGWWQRSHPMDRCRRKTTPLSSPSMGEEPSEAERSAAEGEVICTPPSGALTRASSPMLGEENTGSARRTIHLAGNYPRASQREVLRGVPVLCDGTFATPPGLRSRDGLAGPNRRRAQAHLRRPEKLSRMAVHPMETAYAR